jgi:hypothetical protein
MFALHMDQAVALHLLCHRLPKVQIAVLTLLENLVNEVRFRCEPLP